MPGDVCLWFEDICHLEINRGKDTLIRTEGVQNVPRSLKSIPAV